MGVPDLNETVKELLNAIRAEVEIPPKDWVSLGQAAAHWGINRQTACKILSKNYKEKRKFRVKIAHRVASVMYYRLK